mgnify:CR=1 FL=1
MYLNILVVLKLIICTNFKYFENYLYCMGEKIRFFPLDAVYKIIDGKAVIHLFGRTEDGKQICILDENFQPYFYVIPKQNANAREKIEKLTVERDNEIYSVTKAEIVEKTYFGKEIEAIKVFTKLPRDIPVIRDIIREWEMIESINEYDILFTRRYLIDKNIIPMTLYEAEGEFANLNLKVPGFKAEKIEHLGDTTLLKPKILAIDIETYTPSNRVIEPEKNPIIMAALHSDDFQKVVELKKRERISILWCMVGTLALTSPGATRCILLLLSRLKATMRFFLLKGCQNAGAITLIEDLRVISYTQQ